MLITSKCFFGCLYNCNRYKNGFKLFEFLLGCSFLLLNVFLSNNNCKKMCFVMFNKAHNNLEKVNNNKEAPSTWSLAAASWSVMSTSDQWEAQEDECPLILRWHSESGAWWILMMNNSQLSFIWVIWRWQRATWNARIYICDLVFARVSKGHNKPSPDDGRFLVIVTKIPEL